MKKLYIVRHAESEGNVGVLQQGPSTPLSEKGLEQTAIIAERFRTIDIDRILSSPQNRAKATADAIAAVIGNDVECSDLLIERKRPSASIGLDKSSAEFLEMEDAILKNYHDLSWRHSDEENFKDLEKRAAELCAYIESLPEENILIVTHGFFTRMVIAHVIFKEHLTSQLFTDFILGTDHSNTGITVLRQSVFKDEPIRWKLLTWNDHAHLG